MMFGIDHSHDGCWDFYLYVMVIGEFFYVVVTIGISTHVNIGLVKMHIVCQTYHKIIDNNYCEIFGGNQWWCVKVLFLQISINKATCNSKNTYLNVEIVLMYLFQLKSKPSLELEVEFFHCI